MAKKKTILDLIDSIFLKLNLNPLAPYQSLNLLLTFLGAAIIFILNVKHILVVFNNLFINIANFVIILVKDNPTLLEKATDGDSLSKTLCILILFAETIICLIYCHFAKEKESSNS